MCPQIKFWKGVYHPKMCKQFLPRILRLIHQETTLNCFNETEMEDSRVVFGRFESWWSGKMILFSGGGSLFFTINQDLPTTVHFSSILCAGYQITNSHPKYVPLQILSSCTTAHVKGHNSQLPPTQEQDVCLSYKMCFLFSVHHLLSICQHSCVVVFLLLISLLNKRIHAFG